LHSATETVSLALGTFRASASLLKDQEPVTLAFTVTDVPKLNLLGRDAIVKLGVNVSALLGVSSTPGKGTIQNLQSITDTKEPKPDEELQQACRKLCGEFTELFKPELGCLKDFQLEIKFKAESKSTFCKPRPVPFAILDDLNQAYDAGIAKGVWKPTQFNAYGTPVVPIRKKVLPGQPNGKIRVCGDYSVAINAQLETHRYPIPLPEDLMRKLSGGYGFSKIDLADAYNQVLLGPESQKRLALSTHRGVLLQLRLPFGISSAPGYFQEIMDQLTGDLKGVGTYFDDILVSGTNASEHLENLRALLQRLQDKGLRCRFEKCHFAEPSIEYMGHTLSQKGIAKGSKTSEHGNADALSRLPAEADTNFDGEEDEADVDVVCAIRTIGQQLNPTDPGVLARESANDPVISNVIRCTREGWPERIPEIQTKDYSMENFKKISMSLSVAHGCLLNGSRIVIPSSLQPQVLQLLHLGHFGIQRMKQLARTAVYWPGIDKDIMDQCQRCSTCGEHQNKVAKPANHPWMLPEKPWSRLHVDHAINFLGSNCYY
ncbi:hypothetical protein EMCRGX_G018764, partial [Ephydatia muelleri]